MMNQYHLIHFWSIGKKIIVPTRWTRIDTNVAQTQTSHTPNDTHKQTKRTWEDEPNLVEDKDL